MLAVAICDDEILDSCNLAGIIKDILDDMEVTYTIKQFQQGQDLLNAIENFDIIFLDILMCDINGMKTAQILRKKQFDKIIVFVSSSREYVMDAFEVEAFHYLTKPVDRIKLENTIKRALSRLEHITEEFIIINKERQNKKIRLSDIYYFEIRGRIISVHSKNGTFDYYGQISALEHDLRDKGFFRCHKSFVVNLKYADTYNHKEVTLDNGEKIMIAQRRYDAFCREILEYMKKIGGSI